ncbi:MAG: LysR family transcriptional regulator [Myxococcota bacterium]
MSQLQEIEAFVAVGEQGSFVAAARTLGVSSSYASKLITRLEERLGTRLIQRTTRRLTLTPHGERYLEDCKGAFQLLRKAEECIHETTVGIRGMLRVTVPTALGLGVLADLFHRFVGRHPDVEFQVHYLDRRVDLIG